MNQKNGGTAYLDTLCAYLDNERNWSATAAALGVHKQTLAYRLQRIEKLTGRNLKSTRDIAEMWIARSALERR
jgi:purine catabolism regulator